MPLDESGAVRFPPSLLLVLAAVYFFLLHTRTIICLVSFGFSTTDALGLGGHCFIIFRRAIERAAFFAFATTAVLGLGGCLLASVFAIFRGHGDIITYKKPHFHIIKRTGDR